jgi:hypothetical protein
VLAKDKQIDAKLVMGDNMAKVIKVWQAFVKFVQS